MSEQNDTEKVVRCLGRYCVRLALACIVYMIYRVPDTYSSLHLAYITACCSVSALFVVIMILKYFCDTVNTYCINSVAMVFIENILNINNKTIFLYIYSVFLFVSLLLQSDLRL